MHLSMGEGKFQPSQLKHFKHIFPKLKIKKHIRDTIPQANFGENRPTGGGEHPVTQVFCITIGATLFLSGPEIPHNNSRWQMPPL